MKKNLLLLLSAIVLVSCIGTSSETDVPVYNESQLISATAEIDLQDLIKQGYETEIIHLVKDDGQEPVIMGTAQDVEILDDCILILTSDSQVYKFSRDGKFICTIGTIGNGPGEFGYLNNIYVASNGEDICFNDIMKGVHTYTRDGVYKNTEKSETLGASYYTLTDNQYIIESQLVQIGREPYKLQIKNQKSGEVKKFANHLLWQYTPKSNVTAYIEYKSLFKTDNGEIVYHQQGTDSLFTNL